MATSGFLAHFTDQKTIVLNSTADKMVAIAGQTTVCDQDFADAITVACDPVCDLDVPYILGDLLQSKTYKKAVHEVERWTMFKGGESLAPPSQDFRKHVLRCLAVAINNSLCE